ncbi:hypothetical protein GQ53DRAFT_112020 [Thozetella sp. PMI_491]|nr:hypothetical protein GQ53DRAFT_112020 [Thozetella sp. PMI_491]
MRYSCRYRYRPVAPGMVMMPQRLESKAIRPTPSSTTKHLAHLWAHLFPLIKKLPILHQTERSPSAAHSIGRASAASNGGHSRPGAVPPLFGESQHPHLAHSSSAVHKVEVADRSGYDDSMGSR